MWSAMPTASLCMIVNLSEGSRAKMANIRPQRADFRPPRADFKSQRADFRPETAYFRTEVEHGINKCTQLDIQTSFKDVILFLQKNEEIR